MAYNMVQEQSITKERPYKVFGTIKFSWVRTRKHFKTSSNFTRFFNHLHTLNTIMLQLNKIIMYSFTKFNFYGRLTENNISLIKNSILLQVLSKTNSGVPFSITPLFQLRINWIIKQDISKQEYRVL